jgi:hypothetical protein
MSRLSEPMLASPEDVYNMMKEGTSLKDKVSYVHPIKTGNRHMNISLGRAWFNICLPDDFPLVNETQDKKHLNQLVIDIYKKYGVEKATEYLTTLQSEAFKLATLSPNSFNIEVFIPPNDWLENKEEFLKIADKLPPIEFKKEAEKLNKELLKYVAESGYRLENILEFGPKGNPVDDWMILMVAKGYVIDVEGNLLGPITQSINDGYNRKNFYNAAAEARRNFFFRSALTAEPGYLTAKTVMANAGLKIDDSISDCKTKRYFTITVDESLANILLNRYYVDENSKLKKITNPNEILNKTIRLRSPLYCKAENGICPICYGDSWKILNSKNIGILAGGAINTVGVETLMKMRHKSSSVSTKEVNFIDMIKKSGTDITKLEIYFEINKTTIIAKQSCTIFLDEKDYENDQEAFIDCGDRYQIPGTLNVQFGEPPDFKEVVLPINIVVNLMKPNNYEENKNITALHYEPGETILYQEYYNDAYDERIMNRLFEGNAKYLNNPEILTLVIHDKLKGIDLVHIESIVSNMFRDADDFTIPARLINYKKVAILGQKKLPYETSWLNSLAFENINRAIKLGLLEGKDAKMDPIEKIVVEKYYHD